MQPSESLPGITLRACCARVIIDRPGRAIILPVIILDDTGRCSNVTEEKLSRVRPGKRGRVQPVPICHMAAYGTKRCTVTTRAT